MNFDLANQDRKALGLPPLDMEAIFIKLYLGEELDDEEIFAIRPRWLRDELEKSKLPPDDKLQVIQRVQRLKDDLERRDPLWPWAFLSEYAHHRDAENTEVSWESLRARRALEPGGHHSATAHPKPSPPYQWPA